MKKVTLEINGEPTAESAKDISGALNELSGVVAADSTGNAAYAYAGDKLQKETLENAVRGAGYSAKAIGEEYLYDVN